MNQIRFDVSNIMSAFISCLGLKVRWVIGCRWNNRELMVSGELRKSGKYKSKPHKRIKGKSFFYSIYKNHFWKDHFEDRELFQMIVRVAFWMGRSWSVINVHDRGRLFTIFDEYESAEEPRASSSEMEHII